MENLADLVSKGWEKKEKQNDFFIYLPKTDKAKEYIHEVRSEDEHAKIMEEWKGANFTKSKQLLKHIILERVPNFKFEQDITAIIKNFCLWAWRDPSSELDLTKGIMLIGKPGSGKTTIMECFSKWTDIIGRRPFRMCYGKAECDKARNEKMTQVDNKYFRGIWCIDEIGHDKGLGKVWGNEVSYISDLLEDRYMKKLITHGTTNLEYHEMKYEPRVISRMFEMFNPIYLDSHDWRKENYIINKKKE